jgi:hypothetical protein
MGCSILWIRKPLGVPIVELGDRFQFSGLESALFHFLSSAGTLVALGPAETTIVFKHQSQSL